MRRRRRDGAGTLDTLAADQDRPTDLALDATHVYWITASGVYATRK